MEDLSTLPKQLSNFRIQEGVFPSGGLNLESLSPSSGSYYVPGR